MVKQKTQTAVLYPFQVEGDFKNAALLVSLTINAAVFVGWLAIQLTSRYDYQVVQFLFSR